MKALTTSRFWHLLTAFLIVFAGVASWAPPALAQTGSVASAATPSTGNPGVGEQVVVSINIDVSGVNSPDNKLGSFTGTLDWDPAVLQYDSDSGILAGFTGVVNPSSGHVIFNGANPSGATGNVTVLTITFDVIGSGSSVLDLGYSAMSAAVTFVSLLPILTVTDGGVDVPGGSGTVTLDGAVSSGTADGVSFFDLAHTTGTGANRLTLVGVSSNSYNSAQTISSVTFTPQGGSATALSLVGSVENESGRLAAIYALFNPGSGQAGTVRVTYSGSVGYGIVMGAANFAGVDPSDPLDDFVSAVGTDETPTVAVTTDGHNELVFDTVFLGAATLGTLAAGSGQTERWNATIDRVRGTASTEQATGGSVTMNWAVTGGATSRYWAIGAVPINPAAAEPNEPPVVDDIPNQTIAEGASFATISLDSYVADPDDGDSELTWSYSGNSELAVSIVNRVATISVPDADWNGSETITFKATDPGSLWDQDSATFTVTGVNDPPEAEDDSANTGQNTLVNIDVLDNDDDVDGDTLEVTSVSDPPDGTASIKADDTVDYTPDGGFVGVDSFTYTISDGHGGTDTATVEVTVAGACEITYVGDVGTATIKDGNEDELTVTTTSAVAAGDDIVISYSTGPNQDLGVAVSDSAGNDYETVALARNYGYGRTYIFAAYDVNALPSGSEVTITSIITSGDMPIPRAAVVSVFRGMVDVDPLDQALGNPAFDDEESLSGTTPSVGPTGTAAQADELLVSAIGTEGPVEDSAGTWQNSFITGARVGTTGGDATSNWTVSMGYRIVSETGAYTAQKTGITSRRWAATIGTFKAECVVATHELTITVDPAGGGTTTPSEGVHTYAEDSVVGVSATPASGYDFDHWGGACTGTGDCQVTMDADKQVTAHFVENTPPDTTITLHPDDPSDSTDADFEFTSSETGSTFQCRLDGGSYGACSSPKSYTGLADGPHTFDVYAIDGSGNPDPTPASFGWTIQVPVPGITISKTPDNQTVRSGDSAQFTITVTNSGEVTLTDVAVVDALAPDCDEAVGMLASGAHHTYSCAQANVTANFTNEAEASGTPPVGADVSDSDTADVTVVSPSIEIEKTPDNQTVRVGETATFSIKVTNSGDTSLSEVTITDVLVPDCDLTISSMGAGTQTSYSCDAVNVTTGFTNVVEVTALPPLGDAVTDSDSAVVAVINPAIEISKTPDEQTLRNGGTAQFTIAVTNTGDVGLVGVAVADALAPDCDLAIGIMPAGSHTIFTCSQAGVTTDFTNVASVVGTPPLGAAVGDSDDADVDVINPAIAISKTPDTQTVRSGDAATFTITVTNTGDSTLTGVAVVDALAPDCDEAIGTLAAGAFHTFTCSKANVTAGFTNVSQASGSPSVGADVSASDAAEVEVINPEVAIGKVAVAPMVASGADAAFTITVSNLGDVALTDVTVTDALTPDCDRVVGGLAVGGEYEFTCSATAVSESFTNLAAVVAAYVGGGQVSDSAEADVEVDHAPYFSSTPGLTVTQLMTYTYAVVAADDDAGDTLTLSIHSGPPWLALEDDGDGTGTLSGMTALAGDYAVELRVTDVFGLVGTQAFTITVQPAPGPTAFYLYVPLVSKE